MTLKSILITGLFLASASIASAAGHSTVHTVTIKGFAFEPSNLTIAVGDSVNFVNMDGAPHTATQIDGAFDTGRLSRTDESTIVFSAAGLFAYFCGVHPSMTAQITVE